MMKKDKLFSASTPNLRFMYEATSEYSNLVFQHPADLTIEKEAHITCSSTISGITVTKDNDIVAVFCNGRMVSIYMTDENGAPSQTPCNVKRNWIQPLDAAAAYDLTKKKNVVYVTDSDSQFGYIFSFEIKRREPGKCKQFVSLQAQTPKGIATNRNEIYVCFPEQKSVYVYSSSKQLKQKIDLRTRCTYPLHVSCSQSEIDDILVVTDDKMGTHEQSSVVFLKINGDFITEIKLDSPHISQIDVDGKRTIFIGDSRSPVIHAIVKDMTYVVNGDFSNILETNAIAVDKKSRLIVGHRRGIDILQVHYGYDHNYQLSPSD